MSESISRDARGMMFNPDQCAALHNKLVARVTDHFSGSVLRVRHGCVEQALQYAPAWADTEALQAGDVARFLSQVLVLESQSPGVSLTRELRFPDPGAFWNLTYGEASVEQHFILLYPTGLDIQNDSGLFFDMSTKLVTWGDIEYGRRLPPSDSTAWIPLELALRKALRMWDRGKYYWSGDAILMRSFTPKDVDDALVAWNRLLEAIQSRIGEPDENTYRDPLPSSLVNKFKISPFAKAFLTRARRPAYTFIAPGITTFTDERFEAVMSSEDPDSPRCRFMSRFEDSPDMRPSLIFPVADESSTIGPFRAGHQSMEWLTVSLLPGLYTDVDDMFADTARLVPAKTTTSDPCLQFSRLWGFPRSIRFAELLSLCASYVVGGTWEVGVDGVSTAHGWFTNASTPAELPQFVLEDAL